MDALQDFDCPLNGKCADPRCLPDVCWPRKIAEANEREITETRAYWIKRQVQSIRAEAALRAIEEMVAEHNQAVRARRISPHWPMASSLLTLPTDKSDAEVLHAMVTKVLTAAKQTDRMQRHMIGIMAERGIEISAIEVASEIGTDH
jgi:hypothetical protein